MTGVIFEKRGYWQNFPRVSFSSTWCAIAVYVMKPILALSCITDSFAGGGSGAKGEGCVCVFSKLCWLLFLVYFNSLSFIQLYVCLFFFFFLPYQNCFTYIEPIIKKRWESRSRKHVTPGGEGVIFKFPLPNFISSVEYSPRFLLIKMFKIISRMLSISWEKIILNTWLNHLKKIVCLGKA